MSYSAWDFISELLTRTHGGELHFRLDRMEAVKGRVPIILIDGNTITLQTGRPVAWPDIGEHINGDMVNGHDAA